MHIFRQNYPTVLATATIFTPIESSLNALSKKYKTKKIWRTQLELYLKWSSFWSHLVTLTRSRFFQCIHSGIWKFIYHPVGLDLPLCMSQENLATSYAGFEMGHQLWTQWWFTHIHLLDHSCPTTNSSNLVIRLLDSPLRDLSNKYKFATIQ